MSRGSGAEEYKWGQNIIDNVGDKLKIPTMGFFRLKPHISCDCPVDVLLTSVAPGRHMVIILMVKLLVGGLWEHVAASL